MSDAVTAGVATVALAPCLALAGAACAAGCAVWKAMNTLSERARRDAEELERALREKPPEYVNAKTAVRHFEQLYRQARAEAARKPSLAADADAVARMAALRRSALGSFIRREEWGAIAKARVEERAISAAIKRAESRLTETAATHVSRSVTEAANEAGFTAWAGERRDGAKHTFVLTDDVGRAVVADVVQSDEGAKVSLDLTGFGDGSCHQAMDRLLAALAKRNIKLSGLSRRSHYRADGITESAHRWKPPRARAPKPAPARDLARDASLRRRRTHHAQRVRE